MKTEANRDQKSWLLNLIKRYFLKIQGKCVPVLNQRCKNWSTKKWKVVFILFLLMFSSLNMISIVSVFRIEKVNKEIHEYGHVQPSETNHVKVDNKLGQSERDRIETFCKYLDSLSKTRSGIRTIDSIKSVRPGLLDSLKQAAIFYQINFKKYESDFKK